MNFSAMKYFLDLFFLESYRNKTHKLIKFISKRNKTYKFIKQD